MPNLYRYPYNMKKNEVESYIKFFKVLGSPVRLKILMHIAECKDTCHKHNISELSEDCNVDFSVVSRHLKALKEAGILKSKQNKNDVIYELNRDEVKKVLKRFTQKF